MTTTIKVIKKETLLQVSIMNTLHVAFKTLSEHRQPLWGSTPQWWVTALKNSWKRPCC